MQNYVGNIIEFQLNVEGKKTVHMACPDKLRPAPGQYLLAHAPSDPDALLATVLFPTALHPGGFIAAPPIPATWALGTPLHLSGPFGKGFRLPTHIRNLALVTLGETVSRLLPLLPLADNPALFTASPFHLFSSSLPLALEINPLSDLPAALRWADYLVLDLPLERLPDLPKILGLSSERFVPCPAQVLVHTPMPCGGLADCGVCAVGDARRYALACKEGPVFDLREVMK
jgi:dihydroorotate dehydrogenase electron transfer subunit